MNRLELIWILVLAAMVCCSAAGTVEDPHPLVRVVQAKGELVKDAIERRQAEGRDVREVVARARNVKALADAGKLAEANLLLDEIIVLLHRADHAPRSASAGPAGATFAKPQRVEIEGYDSHSMEPFISRDGRYLFFNDENRPEANTNLYYAERINDRRFRFVGEVRGVNTRALEGVASMDRDGIFYFVSTRSYDEDTFSLFRGRFRDGEVTGVEPVTGISWRTRGWLNMDAEIGADGRTLYYTQSLFTGGSLPVRSNLFVARQEGGEFVPHPASADLMEALNTPSLEYAPSTSADETEIYFSRAAGDKGLSRFQMLRATRTDRSQPFGDPEVLDGLEGVFEAPSLSGDGRLLYFHKLVDGRYRIFVMARQHPDEPK